MKTKHLLSALSLSVTAAALVVAPVSAATIEQRYTASDDALEYLQTQLQTDGSVAGYGGESDWVAIALAAAGVDPTTFATDSGASLAEFVTGEATPGTTTGIERKILALHALGEDTSALTALLLTHFDGTQFGSKDYLNDDTFAIMAYAATADATLADAAQASLEYLLERQDPLTGGFTYCAIVDPANWCGVNSNDTAATLVALQSAKDMGLTSPLLDDAMTEALTYLMSTQQSDGGFSYDEYSGTDGSSTAWAVIALDALSLDTTEAVAWMLSVQGDDGGFSYYAWGMTDSDTYTTPHAIIALLGTTWTLTPEPAERPVVVEEDDTDSTPVDEGTTGEQTPSEPETTPTPTPATPATPTTTFTPATTQPETTPEVESAMTDESLPVADTVSLASSASENAASNTDGTPAAWRRALGIVLIIAAVLGAGTIATLWLKTRKL